MMNAISMSPFSMPMGCGSCHLCGQSMPLHPAWLYCSSHCQDMANASPVDSFQAAASSPFHHAGQMQNGDVDFSLICQCCQVKSVSGGSCCSKRCSWYTQCRCPQCGRDRGANFIYCSGSCAAQAAQANWCSECGVRQMLAGNSSCGDSNCVAAAHAAFQWNASRRLPRNGSKKLAIQTRHELLPLEDKVRQSLVAQFNTSTGSSTQVLAVIKVAVDANRRKAFLAYRSQVERTMTQLKTPKYGHGGEGNEQRRFFPFSLHCTLGNVAAGAANGPFELSLCTHHAARDEASHVGCDTCLLLQHSFNLSMMHRGSHYSTTSISNALPSCEPNFAGVKALVVARVVVGIADVKQVEYGESPAITVPEDLNAVHSVVVTDGNIANDGAYVFRDDAVDPLYVVLVR